MKKIFCYLLLSFSGFAFSQEAKSKGDWEVMLAYGNTNVKLENTESVGYFSSSRLKKEFSIHKNYSIVSGVDFNNLFLSEGDFYFESKYASLPVSFRAKTTNENSTLYAEFGANFNYLYKFKSIDNANGLEDTDKDLGHSIGLFYKVGYKYNFNRGLKINVAFFNGQDVSSNFKSEKIKSEINNMIGLELGLAILF